MKIMTEQEYFDLAENISGGSFSLWVNDIRDQDLEFLPKREVDPRIGLVVEGIYYDVLYRVDSYIENIFLEDKTKVNKKTRQYLTNMLLALTINFFIEEIQGATKRVRTLQRGTSDYYDAAYKEALRLSKWSSNDPDYIDEFDNYMEFDKICKRALDVLYVNN